MTYKFASGTPAAGLFAALHQQTVCRIPQILPANLRIKHFHAARSGLLNNGCQALPVILMLTNADTLRESSYCNKNSPPLQRAVISAFYIISDFKISPPVLQKQLAGLSLHPCACAAHYPFNLFFAGHSGIPRRSHGKGSMGSSVINCQFRIFRGH